jgi:hypothetical protein
METAASQRTWEKVIVPSCGADALSQITHESFIAMHRTGVRLTCLIHNLEASSNE